MKPINTTVIARKTLPVFLMVFSLLFSGTGQLWAQEAEEGAEEGKYGNMIIGPFDGVDLNAGRIWINDSVFFLDKAVTVKGTSTKLGLLSDLKQGETVKATLKPNEKRPNIPYVLVIERQ
jgi:hypothetical protein